MTAPHPIDYPLSHLHSLLRAGDVEAAWAEVTDLVSRFPSDEQMLLAAAEVAIRRNGPAAALPWLRKATAVSPGNVGALVGVYSRTKQLAGQRPATPWLGRIHALADSTAESIRKGLDDQLLRAALDAPDASAPLRTVLLRGKRASRSIDDLLVFPPAPRHGAGPVCLSLMFRFHNFIDGPPPFPGTRSIHRAAIDSRQLRIIECPVDEIFSRTGRLPDDYIEDLVRRNGVTFVMFTVPGEESLRRFAPSAATVDRLRRDQAVRFILAIFDLAYAHVRHTLEAHAGVVDLTVAIDLPGRAAEQAMPGHPVLGLWTVPDPKLFRDTDAARDIPVSFIGARKAHPERLAALTALRASGLDVMVTGGKGETPIDDAHYASLLRRSLMTLNIPSSWVGAPPNTPRQLKGRVMEAIASGTLLLEPDGSPTSTLFAPMEHYVSFASLDDLAAKVRHYLAHPDEARMIARRGASHLKANYDAANFWQRVLARLPS